MVVLRCSSLLLLLWRTPFSFGGRRVDLLEAGQARAAMIREGSEHTKYYQIWVSD